MQTILHILETVRHGTLTLPAGEVILVLISLSLCLSFRFPRTGLLIAYLAAYRWGWMFYQRPIFDEDPAALVAYIVFGGAVLFLSVIWFMRDGGESS